MLGRSISPGQYSVAPEFADTTPKDALSRYSVSSEKEPTTRISDQLVSQISGPQLMDNSLDQSLVQEYAGRSLGCPVSGHNGQLSSDSALLTRPSGSQLSTFSDFPGKDVNDRPLKPEFSSEKGTRKHILESLSSLEKQQGDCSSELGQRRATIHLFGTPETPNCAPGAKQPGQPASLADDTNETREICDGLRSKPINKTLEHSDRKLAGDDFEFRKTSNSLRSHQTNGYEKSSAFNQLTNADADSTILCSRRTLELEDNAFRSIADNHKDDSRNCLSTNDSVPSCFEDRRMPSELILEHSADPPVKLIPNQVKSLSRGTQDNCKQHGENIPVKMSKTFKNCQNSEEKKTCLLYSERFENLRLTSTSRAASPQKSPQRGGKRLRGRPRTDRRRYRGQLKGRNLIPEFVRIFEMKRRTTSELHEVKKRRICGRTAVVPTSRAKDFIRNFAVDYNVYAGNDCQIDERQFDGIEDFERRLKSDFKQALREEKWLNSISKVPTTCEDPSRVKGHYCNGLFAQSNGQNYDNHRSVFRTSLKSDGVGKGRRICSTSSSPPIKKTSRSVV